MQELFLMFAVSLALPAVIYQSLLYTLLRV